MHANSSAAIQAVNASLAEWQNQIASRPNKAGRTAIRTGGHTRLRDREIASAFFVHPVDCQKEMIKMLYPARKNPQKYGRLLLSIKAISSISPGLKMEKK